MNRKLSAMHAPTWGLVRRLALAIVSAGSLLGFSGLPGPANAVSNQTVVIENDRGGSIEERIRIIRQIRRSGARVEIRGEVCLSACTMYLAVPGVCVEPETVFGFHGPSSRLYGVALRNDQFEKWSTKMAEYYPEPIRSWFLGTARHTIVGFQELRGTRIIDMGIKRCAGKY